MNVHQPPQVRTTCPYCGVGCGLLATPDGRGGAVIAAILAIRRISDGCARRASALGETLGLTAGCCIRCCARRDGSWRGGLGRARSTGSPGNSRTHCERDGPDAVAFYLSGQLLTEDYYVANKLMKGFIGSANVDTNSRLCMASSVAGHRRAFGADTVPGSYEDLDDADLIVLVGSNAAWCHPVLYQRMMRQQARARREDRCDRSAPHRDRRGRRSGLAIAPGSGHRAVLRSAGAPGRARRARLALDRDAHERLRRRAGARQRSRPTWRHRARDRPEPRRGRCASSICSVTPQGRDLYSQGVNQSAQGTDKVNAIINCHLATGRIGKPGMGPFSLTGQPNAMGGREVGGLANQLAAHMGFDADGRRPRRAASGTRRAWRKPKASRRSTCSRRSRDGKIKALWVMATNPAVSHAGRRAVRAALRQARVASSCPRMCSSNDTVTRRHMSAAGRRLGREGRHGHQFRAAHFAPARLPAAAGRGQAGLVDREGGGAPHGICGAVRIRLGRPTMFREHAALSAFENDGDARFRHRRARCPRRRWLRCARADAMARAGATPGHAIACSRTAASSRPTARRTSLRPSRRRRAPRPHRTSRSVSTPGACATTGTP